MNMVVDNLCTFISLSEEGSFTTSGKSLRILQSAISFQIAGLERQFGLRFIDRSTRPIKLTEAGLVFLQFSILISSAVVFFVFFAFWEYRNYASGDGWALWRSGLYFLVALGFGIYLTNLKRWYR